MTGEKIFVVGGTGNVGSRVIKDLLQKESNSVTAYVRSIDKAQQLFGNPSNLTLVQGDYADLTLFEKSIAGHPRLFLVVHDPDIHDIPKHAAALSERAYRAGVQQIVTVSSVLAAAPYRSSFIGDASYKAETAIASIPNRGTIVTLRPSSLMTNHLW